MPDKIIFSAGYVGSQDQPPFLMTAVSSTGTPCMRRTRTHDFVALMILSTPAVQFIPVHPPAGHGNRLRGESRSGPGTRWRHSGPSRDLRTLGLAMQIYLGDYHHYPPTMGYGIMGFWRELRLADGSRAR